MNINEIYDKLIEKFLAVPGVEALLDKSVVIKRDEEPEPALMPWNYIPFKGRRPEYRVTAKILGTDGEAYTETPENFEGTLKEALELPYSEKGIDARTLAAINAVMDKKDLCAGIFPPTFDERRMYSDALFLHMTENYGRSNIILVGYDGYFVKKFVSEDIDFWTMDRDPDNVSQDRFKHVVVNSAKYNREACFAWGKFFLVTGSTLTNGTIVQYLDSLENPKCQGKPMLFYGVTIGGAATLLNLPWFRVLKKPNLYK